MQLEAIHVRLQINTSAVVEKLEVGHKRRQRQVHSACTVATVDGGKAPLGRK